MLVAYRYREPSVIRSDKMDQLSLPALDPQCFPLAGVRGVVPICNRNGTKLIYKTFQQLFENEMIKNIFHFLMVSNSVGRNETCQIVPKKVQFKEVFRSMDNPRKESFIVSSLSNVSFSRKQEWSN